jgi:hypothetical protein
MVWTPPSITAGQYPPAADLEYAFDQIADDTAPGWTDYSSQMTVTGSTTSPTLGNSTRQASYRRVPGGDIVFFQFKLTIGSTFTAGSGDYTFSLPVSMSSPQIATGIATYFDSGSAFYVANLVPISATGVISYRDGVGFPLGSGGPGSAWATGDYVAGFITYPA